MNRISLTEPLICIPETITTLKINGNSIFLKSGDFSGGPVDKNQPPKGEDTSSIPSLGRFHMQQGIYSHTLELLNPHALESVLCNKSVPTIRSHPTATRESLHLAPKTQGSKKWMNKIFFKKGTHHAQVGFIPVSQEWFSIHKSSNVTKHINNGKDKNLMIVSTDTGNAFHKIQHPFIVKTLPKLGMGGTHLNIIKAT